MFHQSLVCSYLFDFSLVHNDNLVSQGNRFHLVVSDVKAGDPKAMEQAFNLRASLDAQFCIEVGEWLIKEEEPRRTDNGTSERHTLPFAARERARFARQQFVESYSHHLRRVTDALARFLRR